MTDEIEDRLDAYRTPGARQAGLAREEEGRRAATARWWAFAALPEAEGKAKTAIALADNTSCTAEEARRILRSAPYDVE